MHEIPWARSAGEEDRGQPREAGQGRIVRQSPGGSMPPSDRARSEPLTAVGRRLLHGLLGAGSADSFYTVRMPSGHWVRVEDTTDLR